MTAANPKPIERKTDMKTSQTKQGVMIGGVFTSFDQRKPAPNKAQHSPLPKGAGLTDTKWTMPRYNQQYVEGLKTKAAHADKLAALLKSARAELGRCKDHNCWKLCDDINTEIAAYEAAQ